MKRAAFVLASLSLLLASSASAHPQEFGSVHAREIAPGRYAVRFEYSGTESEPRGASIVWPEACALEGSIERSDRAYVESQRMTVSCDRPGLAREATIDALPADVEIAVRIERLDGSIHAQLIDAGAPRFTLARSDDAVSGTLARFVVLGVEHIAIGLDHLAFVALLVLVVRRSAKPPRDATQLVRPLLLTLTAFTIGHAITLALSVLELVHVPVAPVEACIALSVLLLAAEVARAERSELADTLVFRHPAVVAGTFGLVHGLGFASALRDAGLSDSHLAWSLVGFHVGIELGQLVFVMIVLALLRLAVSMRSDARASIALAYLTGTAAVVWTLVRVTL
ncbi:MAG: HupE/UreJ family protein [Deltaproteobacteria bacterium]|nr:HupE/UreJ family protein [Deltaproteobacteria bacterium]